GGAPPRCGGVAGTRLAGGRPRVGKRGAADRAGFLQHRPALAGGADVRPHVVGHVGRRRRRDVDGNLAAQVQAGEVVPVRLRNRHAVADEHHRRLDRAVELPARGQRRLLPQRDRLFFTVAHERQLRLLRRERARLQLHRLAISGPAARLQPDLLELRLDVGRSLLVTGRADVSSLEPVVGEELDVAPPALALGGRVLQKHGENGDQQVSSLHDRRILLPPTIFILPVRLQLQGQTAADAVRMTREQDDRITGIVGREQSRLWNFIRRRVPDARDAEDILQEVFAELVEANRLLMPIDHAAGWLFSVARNRITDLFRRRRPERVSDVGVPDDEERLLLEDLLPSPDAGPDTQYARHVLLEALELALADLPPDQREVCVAHEIEGRTFKEIAAETGVGINTLLSRKRYAVLRLRERLQDVYDEWTKS